MLRPSDSFPFSFWGKVIKIIFSGSQRIVNPGWSLEMTRVGHRPDSILSAGREPVRTDCTLARPDRRAGGGRSETFQFSVIADSTGWFPV